MKKFLCGVAAAAALMSATAVFAQSPSVYFDGEKLDFDVEPYIAEERTMVPFRAIFEKAGANVMWDDESKTVVAVRDNESGATSVVLQIGSADAFVNDRKIVLDKAAEITGDCTFVPLRFVMEAFGAKVDWNQDDYSITIITK